LGGGLGEEEVDGGGERGFLAGGVVVADDYAGALGDEGSGLGEAEDGVLDGEAVGFDAGAAGGDGEGVREHDGAAEAGVDGLEDEAGGGGGGSGSGSGGGGSD